MITLFLSSCEGVRFVSLFACHLYCVEHKFLCRRVLLLFCSVNLITKFCSSHTNGYALENRRLNGMSFSPDNALAAVFKERVDGAFCCDRTLMLPCFILFLGWYPPS
jgi:hypothetical protein